MVPLLASARDPVGVTCHNKQIHDIARSKKMAITVSEEVQTALRERLPVVGLESSNVTGGKYPANLEISHEIDDAVRSRGAIPARIAVIRGDLHVGISPIDLEVLASAADVEKVSNRELGTVMARGQSAGTTVSASLVGGSPSWSQSIRRRWNWRRPSRGRYLFRHLRRPSPIWLESAASCCRA